MLVDDEAVVRGVTSALLQDLGFEVDEAVDGLDAVERIRVAPNGYTLVVMDLTMPRMGGKEAFVEMRSLSSTVKILLFSGYSEEAVDALARSPGYGGFLKKPFTADELQIAVSRALRR
ncbi:MAG: response regulator [Polyangiaceae bacterium]